MVQSSRFIIFAIDYNIGIYGYRGMPRFNMITVVLLCIFDKYNLHSAAVVIIM